jgi:hypothetical protein
VAPVLAATAGTALLVAVLVDGRDGVVGTTWPFGSSGLPGPDEVGAVLVASACAWALAARTGGRPVVFGLLALAVGVVVLATDIAVLRSGAAVMTAVLGAVLGVLLTRPAARFLRTLPEVALALLVAAAGGLAAAGFRAEVDLDRFRYLTLGLAFVLAAVLVYRLGAGFHGLGARGLLVVLAGVLVVGATLAYTELLRAYGAGSWPLGGADAVREGTGGTVRPIQALLGVPALVWGCHQRARRRQGWWACAFGVAATAPVAQLLVDPRLSLGELAVTEGLSLLTGLLLGYVVVRADLLLTGPRGRGARRRERAGAVRPEPVRFGPLL